MEALKKVYLYSTCMLVSLTVVGQSIGGRLCMSTLKDCIQRQISVPDSMYAKLYSQTNTINRLNYVPSVEIRHALFIAYPALRLQLPVANLANLPTPVQKLDVLGGLLGIEQLYIKRDDLTGLEANGERLFGGNKLRKLEFLFGDALLHGASAVMTFGYSGSNHVVATAACAQFVGLSCIAMLKPQQNSRVVRRNLLLMNYYGADIHYCVDNEIRALGALYSAFKQKSDTGQLPYVIPTGGSCPIGVVGYINAIFELKEQIEKGLLSEPDRVYVATGSCGTHAGLLLGVKSAGLKTRIIGVAVEPEEFPGALKQTIVSLCNNTNQLLNRFDPTFPLFPVLEDDVEILMEHAGNEYGLFTAEAVDAIRLIKESQEIELDGTYTGKAMAGMLSDIQKIQKNEVILFWNTFYGDDCANLIDMNDYADLPHSAHQHFELQVQPLDQ